MTLRCRHCCRDIRLTLGTVGSVVTCDHCSASFVSTPLAAPARSQTRPVEIWWLLGDPAIDATTLMPRVQAGRHLWRLHALPTLDRRLPSATPSIVVFGRRHLALNDPLVGRMARQEGVQTVLLSRDRLDLERGRRSHPLDHHLALPVGPTSLVAGLRDLVGQGRSAARLLVP